MCFEKSMKNIPTDWTCDCPVECNYISYSFSLVSTPFNPEELCPRDMVSEDFLMKPFYQNRVGRAMIKMKNNITEIEYCKQHLKYRAEVIFRLATDSISVTVMSRRLSFFDKMSAFGERTNYVLLYSNKLFNFRWHFGVIHRNQHSQYNGGGVLDT